MVSSDQSYLPGDTPLGLPALFEEMQHQGFTPETLLRAAGLRGADLHDRAARLTLFRACRDLMQAPDTALRAGQRQRFNSFGIYGFALATSSSLADALNFSLANLDLAGSIARVDYRVQDQTGILTTVDTSAFGDVLQFAAEFWRASMSTLLNHVLGRRFPTTAMFFPYDEPAHNQTYRDLFDCDLHFGTARMEWHFDIAIMDAPCVLAEASTAGICKDFCTSIADGAGGTAFQKAVKHHCFDRATRRVTAQTVAGQMGVSLRSFHRRLAQEGTSFQTLMDETWAQVATQYLCTTALPIAEIGYRCGFNDVSNFRKTYLRWTGTSPAKIRGNPTAR